MIDLRYDRGVVISSAALWLDPHEPRDLAFVSHAHSDHVGRHGHILCTPPTARLMQTRMGDLPGTLETLNYGERREGDGWAVTLWPAGHVLGSAQLFFENAEGTLLYTGDFKLRPGLSSEAAVARSAETLIMETTYGLPRYQFPPTEEVVAEMVKFCLEAMEEGETPVLLGYALGKAQEILSALRQAGLPLMLHGAVARIARVYQEFGVEFPPFADYDADAVAGHVLICPPNAKGSRMITKIKRRKVAVLTGWALDGGATRRLQVDAAFPLSDHADYPDLLRHVEAVQPRRILTLHGFAQEFARDLRARGWEAWALTGPNQLEFLAVPAAAPAAVREAAPLEPAGFSGFCLVAEAIRRSTGKLEKTRLLADYLASLDEAGLPLAAVWLTGRAFPQSDDQPLNVGSAVIRRALATAAGVAEREVRAIGRRHNDLGLTAEEVLLPVGGAGVVGLTELGTWLEHLRSLRGPRAKGERLVEMLRTQPALASAYFVRILTGDLRIGLKEGLVEDALAEAFKVPGSAVREANMLLGDIGQAAGHAKRGTLDQAELTLFHPIKCMLASPEPDAESLWQRLGESGSVWLEDKLDGIRAQMHVMSGRAELYSRDLRRISATFPEIVAAGCQLPDDAVFDGEILAWGDGRALRFAELQKRLGRREDDFFLGGEIPVVFVIFDLLRWRESSLLKTPLSERRRRLDQMELIPPLLRAPVEQVSGPENIDEAFARARRRGNEGLMAKDPASLYLPGRRGLSWIKLKKEFATLDVVVVAVEYGHGRRSQVLSDYTFAVRGETPGELLPIGKAYSGLTDVEIEQLTEEFLQAVVSKRGNRLTVEPRVVLEIAFDAIQPSGRHASGLAMRFPRIKRIRRDKTVGEVDDLGTARRLAGL